MLLYLHAIAINTTAKVITKAARIPAARSARGLLWVVAFICSMFLKIILNIIPKREVKNFSLILFIQAINLKGF